MHSGAGFGHAVRARARCMRSQVRPSITRSGPPAPARHRPARAPRPTPPPSACAARGTCSDGGEGQLGGHRVQFKILKLRGRRKGTAPGVRGPARVVFGKRVDEGPLPGAGRSSQHARRAGRRKRNAAHTQRRAGARAGGARLQVGQRGMHGGLAHAGQHAGRQVREGGRRVDLGLYPRGAPDTVCDTRARSLAHPTTRPGVREHVRSMRAAARARAGRALAGKVGGHGEAHALVQAQALHGLAAAQLKVHALDVHALWLRQLPAGRRALST